MTAQFFATDREVRLLKLKRAIVNSLVAPMRRRRQRPAQVLPVQEPVDVAPVVFASGWPEGLDVAIDEYSFYRGVLHVRGRASCPDQVVGVGFEDGEGQLVKTSELSGQSGIELELNVPDSEGDARGVYEFSFDRLKHDHEIARDTSLVLYLRSGVLVRIKDIAEVATRSHPVAELKVRFDNHVREVAAPQILEVGSRSRSGNVYRDWLPAGAGYTGFDVLDGDNVDVVGDAHSLSTHFAPETFDAVLSISTFEHLAMPWIATVEINRVMKMGGLVFVATHQTWPVHDAPWDFYRFSEYAWVTLFNKFSGFEILDVQMGDPAQILPTVATSATLGLELQPAFLSSAMLARKVTDSDLRWDADVAAVVRDAYPI